MLEITLSDYPRIIWDKYSFLNNMLLNAALLDVTENGLSTGFKISIKNEESLGNLSRTPVVS